MAKGPSFQSLRRSVRNFVRKEPLDLEPAAAYELWAATYDDIADNALLYAERSVVEPMLRQIDFKDKSVLDAGCGTGRYLNILQQFHPASLAGIDLSPAMLQRAQAKESCNTANLGVGGLEHLPFRAGLFDVVLTTLALGHVSDLSKAIAELSRVMTNGGTLLISDFHPFGKLLSWKRTFQKQEASGEKSLVSARYFLHLYADYFKALSSAKIEILDMHEPLIDESLKPFYERAGRLDIYERFHGYPLLLILLARKK